MAGGLNRLQTCCWTYGCPTVWVERCPLSWGQDGPTLALQEHVATEHFLIFNGILLETAGSSRGAEL